MVSLLHRATINKMIVVEWNALGEELFECMAQDGIKTEHQFKGACVLLYIIFQMRTNFENSLTLRLGSKFVTDLSLKIIHAFLTCVTTLPCETFSTIF